jgi:transposase InsO family protein
VRGINRFVVDAVVLEGRSVRDVARSHGVSKSWAAELVRRFRSGGYDAIEPRSKAPRRVANRTSDDLEDAIVSMRKLLADDGFDCGAHTIHHHLSTAGLKPPSVSTIWRVLTRRGFVTPQPQKRPRSSWVRFEAQLPNECWQTDLTYWRLHDGTDVKIVNFIDDHSRLVVACRAFEIVVAKDVVDVFEKAAETWGYPASVLSDNGAIYTATYRNGRCAMESLLLSLGIAYKHSRPYHPQTCGKVERFHQTLKSFLVKQPPAADIIELQGQLERFIAYYNDVRPHRARDRMTPRAAFDARDKARPIGPKISIDAGVRVRHDIIDKTGVITLRHRSKLHHIRIGAAHKYKRVIVLVDGLDIRVIDEHGEVLRRLKLDPSKDYQGFGTGRWPVHDVPRHPSGMS